jgi:8-oxo-dGTP pyrophosphatase MutT (NUDIX family)
MKPPAGDLLAGGFFMVNHWVNRPFFGILNKISPESIRYRSVMKHYSSDDIRRALDISGFDPQAAQHRMIPRPRGVRLPEANGRTRLGGVLVMLYDKSGQTYLVLTRRRDDLEDHAGQISFPGGRKEDGESLEVTAVREAQEEIGIDPASLTILGRLTSLYIPPTDYEVHPFVAWHQGSPAFNPQANEVAEILATPRARGSSSIFYR